jgi:hypothetical protein
MPWSIVMSFHDKNWITPLHCNFSQCGEFVMTLKTKWTSDGDIDVMELHVRSFNSGV